MAVCLSEPREKEREGPCALRQKGRAPPMDQNPYAPPRSWPTLHPEESPKAPHLPSSTARPAAASSASWAAGSGVSGGAPSSLPSATSSAARSACRSAVWASSSRCTSAAQSVQTGWSTPVAALAASRTLVSARSVAWKGTRGAGGAGGPRAVPEGSTTKDSSMRRAGGSASGNWDWGEGWGMPFDGGPHGTNQSKKRVWDRALKVHRRSQVRS